MFFYALGAWAEMVTASVEVVTAVPEELPDQIAPQLHVNPLTAILLFRRAQDAGVNKLAGKGLVLDAAGSTVGKMILEFASLAAVPVLGAVRRAEAAEKLQGRFPHARFLSTANASWSNALAAAAPSGGWFVALDAVSGAVGSALFDALAPGGRLVTYGDLSEEPLQVNALSFAMRSTRIESLVVSDWVGLTEAQRRREIEPAFELARSLPDLFPVATEVPLAEIRRAAALLECAGREGVVLLRP
jgi:NADPH:quinone reductase-like Zn-dependent oxidoreductase